MSGIRRIVVGLKSHEKSDTIKLAKFMDCIVSHFHPNEISVQVSCKLENNILFLYPTTVKERPLLPKQNADKVYQDEVDFSSVTLQHSPECPVSVLTASPYASTLEAGLEDQGVAVGVSLVVESSDQHILLTQRSDHMRSFPRAWVPPGGHIEYGETLVEGGLRELREETGLKFDSTNSQTQLFCLWESVYPVFLGMGTPKSHHIVVYLHTKAQETWNELQSKINVDPEEVQCWTWLSQEDVKTISTHRNRQGLVNKYSMGPNETEVTATQMELTRMFPSSLWGDRKIYSGTQMALNRWLDYLTENQAQTCKI